VIGRTIDIPGDVFGVDVPDLYYRGTVLKKDNAHPGTIPVRMFPLDPVVQNVEQCLWDTPLMFSCHTLRLSSTVAFDCLL